MSEKPRRTRLRLIAYLRVSSEGQARDDRYGLPSQRAAIRRWAAGSEGEGEVRILRYVSDGGVSGTTSATFRDGLTEALEAVRDGSADGIVVAEMGRLARKLTVQEAILAVIWESGGRAFTVDEGEIVEDDPDDPMRTAMRQMRGIFHQLDRSLINKRLRDGRRTKREATGRAEGAPPYGYRAAAGGLVEVDAEQAGLRRMEELDRAGASTRAIAKALDEEGHPTKRGGKWSSAAVSRILTRRKAQAGGVQ